MDGDVDSVRKEHLTVKSSKVSSEHSLVNDREVLSEEGMVTYKKRSSSLPFLPDQTNSLVDSSQTLPPKISAVRPFTEGLTQEMSGTTWFDTKESPDSSEESSSELHDETTDTNQRTPDSSRDYKPNVSENGQGEEGPIDVQSMNTETRTFVRSSALDILAAFPKSETVASQEPQHLRIAEEPDNQSEPVRLRRNDASRLPGSYMKATRRGQYEVHQPVPSCSSTKNPKEVKKKAPKGKKRKDHDASFSSLGSESSKERLSTDSDDKHKAKKDKRKSAGFINIFRRQSEDLIATKEVPKKTRKPVEKSKSFNTNSTPKNNQLNRMDSFRKFFRRPKDPTARDSVCIENQQKCLDISAPIVKPSFQPGNLVDREVIIAAQRDRAYQLDNRHNRPSRTEDGKEGVLGISEGTGIESNVKNSCPDNQPIAPVRWKHLEKKRQSRATENEQDGHVDDEKEAPQVDNMNGEASEVSVLLNGDHSNEAENGNEHDNYYTENEIGTSVNEGHQVTLSDSCSENNNDTTNNDEEISSNPSRTSDYRSVESEGQYPTCPSPPAASGGNEEIVDDVFVADTKVSVDSDQAGKHDEEVQPDNDNHTSSLKKPKWQSIGSTEESRKAIGSIRKIQSFPGEKSSSTVPGSPKPKMNGTVVRPQGRMSIFGRLPTSPSIFVPEEAPTMVTDLVPTSFPSMSTDRRSQIVLELFTTERTYVRGLETMIELFKKRLLSIMEEKDVDALFSNLNDIYSMNKDLLFLLWEKLKHWHNDECIAQIFIDMEERLKSYAIYCRNFDVADNAFKQRLKRSKEFEQVLKSCYQDPLCQPGLDLPAYLITVIQRIPRYLLLLRDLRNKTSPSHPDYETLNQALTRMHKVAEYINSQLQEIHSKKALQELRSTVIGLKAYEVKDRILLKEAEVCLMSPKKPYKCLLFNDIMVFAVQGTKDRCEIEMTLELKTLWFEDLKKNDPQTSKHDAIELYTPHRPYTMYACSRVEKRVWLQKLRIAIVNLLYGPDYDNVDDHDISRRKASDTYIDGSVYCGEYLNAKRHGRGVMAWPNRTRYEGSWVDDERHGNGSLTYYTGEKYVGSWVADKKDGQGTQTYVNGDVYTGEWSAGKMNGKGIIEFSNGDRFTGDMVDNEAEGNGEMTCITGLLYKGGWKKSKRHGQGHLFFPNKDEYMGELFNDRICGLGKMIYFNGDEYNGEWLNQMRHGRGIMKTVQGNVYDGQWTNDFMNGQGKMVYLNGDEYTGTWHQNKRVGKGQMMYKNGHTYNGQWEDDTMNGRGVMYYKDGSVYDGTWERGKRHRYGTIIYRDKTSYEGEFQSGLRQGRGKLIYSNNVCYVGEWKADKPEGNGVFSDPNTEYSYQGDWVCGMRDGNGVEISYKTRYEGSWKADMRHGQGIEKYHAGHTFNGTWKENRKHGRGVRTLRSGVKEEQQWYEGRLVDLNETVAEDLPLLPRR